MRISDWSADVCSSDLLRSVEENIFLGREITRGPFTDRTAMRRRARALLDRLNCAVPVTARVCDLPVADKQMIEIAKALSRDVRVLILDEPTAVLTEQETASLFQLIGELKAAGVRSEEHTSELQSLMRISYAV